MLVTCTNFPESMIYDRVNHINIIYYNIILIGCCPTGFLSFYVIVAVVLKSSRIRCDVNTVKRAARKLILC